MCSPALNSLKEWKFTLLHLESVLDQTATSSLHLETFKTYQSWMNVKVSHELQYESKMWKKDNILLEHVAHSKPVVGSCIPEPEGKSNYIII